tara:strand:+ start:282 stop:428 length:147 start_codon:yes stop_codon:yes gene_type:complete
MENILIIITIGIISFGVVAILSSYMSDDSNDKLLDNIKKLEEKERNKK